MTACCCRLTQPANSRTRKASGGGSESIAQACPSDWFGASHARFEIVVRCQLGRLVGRSPPAIASNPPNVERFSLGRVFARDGNIARTPRNAWGLISLLDPTSQVGPNNGRKTR